MSPQCATPGCRHHPLFQTTNGKRVCERCLRLHRRRGPPVPEITEKAVQREIKKALVALGWWVQDLTMPRPTMLPAGLPDLWAAHVEHGVWWIEVKTPKAFRSPNQGRSKCQLRWHTKALVFGVPVVTVDSVESCLIALGYGEHVVG